MLAPRMRLIYNNVHRSQLVRKAFLSLVLFVSFVTFFALMTFLYLFLVEADEERKAHKKAFAVVLGITMFALMVACGISSQLSNTGPVLTSIDSEIIPE